MAAAVSGRLWTGEAAMSKRRSQSQKTVQSTLGFKPVEAAAPSDDTTPCSPGMERRFGFIYLDLMYDSMIRVRI